MYEQFREVEGETVKNVLDNTQRLFHTLMGKQPESTSFQEMADIWLISGSHISQICTRAITGQKQSVKSFPVLTKTDKHPKP